MFESIVEDLESIKEDSLIEVFVNWPLRVIVWKTNHHEQASLPIPEQWLQKAKKVVLMARIKMQKKGDQIVL